ncbi:MAG: phosphotransferase family protein, partial [Alphaproteobacteria bacterium]
CSLRAGLDPAFAAVLGRARAVVLEEWVDGRPVDAFEAQATLAWAASLLAGLHARAIPAGEDQEVDASPWLDGACTDVSRLENAGLLPKSLADRARGALSDLAPVRARTAIAHLDLAMENLVVHRAAGPRVIDNEMFAVRPPGFDLARSFHLWPMSEEDWRGFLRVYLSAGGHPDEAADFWRLVALALGTRIFFERATDRRDDAVRRLVELLGVLETSGASGGSGRTGGRA